MGISHQSDWRALQEELVNDDAYIGIVLLLRSRACSEKNGQLFYYAFTYFTTRGFADILSLNTVSQKLSVFTAAVGRFYIAVVVAILISRFFTVEG